MLNQFLKFAFVGGIGTAIHFGILILLVEAAGLDAAVASSVGALFGLVCNYLLNRRFTFASRRAHADLFPRYALVASMGFAINFGLMLLLADRYGVRYLYAQVLTTGLVLLWNFFANRRWTFSISTSGVLPVWPLMLAVVLIIRLLTLGAYPLLDPTEGRYAEMARKMVETGNWITPQIDYGVPFWGKPPLAIWLTALDLLAGGVNEFAVRLPALVLAIGSCLVVWILAASRRPGSGSLVAPAVLASCLLFFVMAGSVATDQALSLAIALAMGSFWLAIRQQRRIWGYLFFLALAAGLLAKGPIALVLTGLPLLIWMALDRQWIRYWKGIPWFNGSLLMLAVALPWYLLAEQKTPGFLEYFLIGEHWKRFTVPGWQGDLYGSGRVHARGTVWIYALLAALPWTPVFLRHLWLSFRHPEWPRPWQSADGWRLYCLLWLLSPLIVFSLSANILWTYVLPGLPAFALLLAEWLEDRPPRATVWVLNLAVPALLLLALAIPSARIIDLLNTQKPLIAAYRQLHPVPGDRLHYLNAKPFSAQFYAAGGVDQIATIDADPAAGPVRSRDYVVMQNRDWEHLSDAVRRNLRVLARHGRFLLASRG